MIGIQKVKYTNILDYTPTAKLVDIDVMGIPPIFRGKPTDDGGSFIHLCNHVLPYRDSPKQLCFVARVFLRDWRPLTMKIHKSGVCVMSGHFWGEAWSRQKRIFAFSISKVDHAT